MSGYNTYTRWQRIEEHAKSIGFRLGRPKMSAWSDSGSHDTVSVFPADDAMPIWTRDAELYTGTFRDVEIWLAGWIRAQEYDRMLRLSDPEKRKKYEDRERARQAEQRKREEQKEMLRVLRATDAENSNKKK